mmetsp:Transcript_23990/g.44835  ORF Transcript_23990/g.44835 Transcript_23990/m.44835 type:complete len:359 (-) Transcript_23990:293-1369(-)
MVCPFVYHDYTFGTIYAILWLVAAFHVRAVFMRPRPNSAVRCINRQYCENEYCIKYFFLALALQCLSRSIGFYSSPSFLPCKRDLVGSGPAWLDIINNIPACFEISTFSALIRAFAVSYHLVLKTGRNHRLALKVVTMSLLAINLLTYALVTAALIAFADASGEQQGLNDFYQIAVCGVCVGSAFLGLTFVVYGWLIMKINSNIFSHMHQCNTLSEKDDSLSNLMPMAVKKQTKPLARMTVLAMVCAICFILRAILLMLDEARHFDVQAHVWTSAIYFSLCEVVPSILMIHLFRRRLQEGEDFQGMEEGKWDEGYAGHSSDEENFEDDFAHDDFVTPRPPADSDAADLEADSPLNPIA